MSDKSAIFNNVEAARTKLAAAAKAVREANPSLVEYDQDLNAMAMLTALAAEGIAVPTEWDVIGSILYVGGNTSDLRQREAKAAGQKGGKAAKLVIQLVKPTPTPPAKK
jgi:hypothetical protein